MPRGICFGVEETWSASRVYIFILRGGMAGSDQVLWKSAAEGVEGCEQEVPPQSDVSETGPGRFRVVSDQDEKATVKDGGKEL